MLKGLVVVVWIDRVLVLVGEILCWRKGFEKIWVEERHGGAGAGWRVEPNCRPGTPLS